MNVLVACEFSGLIREAFRSRGHNAWSCDLLPTEDSSLNHFQCNIFDILGDRAILPLRKRWDLMIGHPPCDHLSLSGARWCKDHWVKSKKHPDGKYWHEGSSKRALREKAAEFFRCLWNQDIEKICLENPMSMASTLVTKRTQEIHPWQFGHPEQKTTWLWLKNLPHLIPTNLVYDQMMSLPSKERQKVWSMTPGPNRKNDRSRTFQGIAQAMAEQWG